MLVSYPKNERYRNTFDSSRFSSAGGPPADVGREYPNMPDTLGPASGAAEPEPGLREPSPGGIEA
jgi:hypothetical protein